MLMQCNETFNNKFVKELVIVKDTVEWACVFVFSSLVITLLS